MLYCVVGETTSICVLAREIYLHSCSLLARSLQSRNRDRTVPDHALIIVTVHVLGNISAADHFYSPRLIYNLCQGVPPAWGQGRVEMWWRTKPPSHRASLRGQTGKLRLGNLAPPPHLSASPGCPPQTGGTAETANPQPN